MTDPGASRADAASPPKPADREMRALTEAETAWLMTAGQGLQLATPVLLAVTCGLRRGEILALAWRDVDLEAGTLPVRPSLEQTPAGLCFKESYRFWEGPRLSPTRRLVRRFRTAP